MSNGEHAVYLSDNDIELLAHAFAAYKLVLTEAAALVSGQANPSVAADRLAHVAGLLLEHQRKACPCGHHRAES